jgi:hypothetical protein
MNGTKLVIEVSLVPMSEAEKNLVAERIHSVYEEIRNYRGVGDSSYRTYEMAPSTVALKGFNV